MKFKIEVVGRSPLLPSFNAFNNWADAYGIAIQEAFWGGDHVFIVSNDGTRHPIDRRLATSAIFEF